MGKMFSYVIGILIAGLIVFGLYFGLQVGSPAYARQAAADKAAEKSLDELEHTLRTGLQSEVIAAITAIGQGNDQLDRRVRLLAQASSSRDLTVKSICTLSIRRMGDAVKDPISKLLKSSDQEEVRHACGAIRALGEGGDMFAPQLLEMLKSEESVDRHAALYGLQDMSAEAIFPGLDGVIKELDDSNFNTQCQACFVLRRLGNAASPATERLVRLLQEGNPSSRSRAAEALASIGPVDGFDIPELVGKQLEANSYMEKTRGLTAVSLLGPDGNTSENMARIQKLIDTPRLNCLPEATLAMYRLTGEKDSALRTLRDLLEKRTSRIQALECLGAMGEDATAAVPEIMVHLGDQEPAICETAVLTLKNIGPTADAALPRLRKMLDHEDFLIAVAAQEAIDAISPKSGD